MKNKALFLVLFTISLNTWSAVHANFEERLQITNETFELPIPQNIKEIVLMTKIPVVSEIIDDPNEKLGPEVYDRGRCPLQQ